MVISTDKYWFAQLDEETGGRKDQRSFHIFAESQHSDVRGQIYNLGAGGELALPHDGWTHHLFVVVGISGAVDAFIKDRTFQLRPLSQLVVLPGTACKLVARAPASVELISLLSMPPRATD